MMCTVNQRRKWRHTWSRWVLATYTYAAVNQRHCTRYGLTGIRSTR